MDEKPTIEELERLLDGSDKLDIEILPSGEISAKPKMFSEDGFAFLDDQNRPYYCGQWGVDLWLFYWHEAGKGWVSLRKVSEAETAKFPRNLSEDEQLLYHAQHLKTMRKYAPYNPPNQVAEPDLQTTLPNDGEG